MPRTKSVTSKKRSRSSRDVGPQAVHNAKIVGPKGAFKSKAIPQSYFKASDFEGTNVLAILNEQGFMGYLCSNLDVEFSLVDYFYRHAKTMWDDVSNDSMFVLELVDGNRFQFSLHDFVREFGLTEDYSNACNYFSDPLRDFENSWSVDVSNAGYGSREELVRKLNHLDDYRELTSDMTKGVNMKYLSGDDKILLMVVRRIIFPTNNKADAVSWAHGVILGLVSVRAKINLWSFIIASIRNAPTNSHSDTYPYGGLITWIMRYWGIAIPGSSGRKSKAGAICRTTYLKQKSECVNGRLVNPCEFSYISRELKQGYKRERELRRARGGLEIFSDEEEHNSEENAPLDDNVDDAPIGDVGVELGRNEDVGSQEEVRRAPPRHSQEGTTSQDVRQELARLSSGLDDLRHDVADLRTESRRQHKSILGFLKAMASKMGCSSSAVDDSLAPSPPQL